MDVGPNRPPAVETDLRAERSRQVNERFGASPGDSSRAEDAASDANTRLSREVDEVELSEEGRELARRDEGDDVEVE